MRPRNLAEQKIDGARVASARIVQPSACKLSGSENAQPVRRARLTAVRVVARAMVCAALFAGCATPEETWDAGPALEPDAVAILDTGAPNNAITDSILRDAFPNALRLRIEQLVAAGPRLRHDCVVLVVPDLRVLSSAHWAKLTNHIRRGGAALFWGLDPSTNNVETETLAMLRPSQEYFTLLAREISGAAGGRTQSSDPMNFQSPLPRETAIGSRDKIRRWIPLASARDPEGHVRGWPASILIEAPPDEPLRAWGWIGWAPSSPHAQAQRALLRRAARALRARQFILTAGLDRAVLGPGEPIDISTRIAASSATAGPWRITVELENEAGVITRRLSSSIAAGHQPATAVTSLVLGVAPRSISRAEDLRLRFTLTDAASGTRLDDFSQRIRMLPDIPQADAPSDERLGVRAAGFVIGRRPLALFGTAFAPLFAGSPGNPLEIDRYNIELALRELDLIRECGLNLVELEYTSLAQAPQLRHLLDELRSRKLWALIRLPSLSPWTPAWETADALLAALRLSQGHRVFAIAVDLAFSPDAPQAQKALCDAWRTWLEEQYGDSSRAETALGYALDSVVPTPAVARDADTPMALRLAIARFFQDHIGRHLRDARRFLDQRAQGTLVTAIGGEEYPLPPPANHLDFVTCTWQTSADSPQEGFLEFRTAHARGSAGGKPVLWRHAGAPSGDPLSADHAQRQADVLEAFTRAIRRASAAGFIYASLSGGLRGANGEDIGLLHPDARWRLGGEALRKQIHEWRRMPMQPPVWRGREADHDVDIAWREWGPRYRDEARAGIVEELRPKAWGRNTYDVPAVALGNLPHEAPAPFQHVNAEWIEPPPESIPLRRPVRRPIRLEIINTGLATWGPSVTGRAGSVWVIARSSGGRSQLLPIRETAPGARAALMWTPTDPGAWTLRGWLHPHGEFGEALRFEVE